MALLPNSSLQSWISFNLTARNNISFPPCQSVNWTIPNADEPTYNLMLPIKTIASCAQVCNDSVSLFGSQDNLATCGLWSSLAYAYSFNGTEPDPNRFIEEAPEDLLDSFAKVGLEAYDPEYLQWVESYADVISTCFVYLYQNVKTLKSANDGLVSGACTKNELFPYSAWSWIIVRAGFQSSTDALDKCLVDICSPVALNPEFAGVGVSLPNIMT